MGTVRPWEWSRQKLTCHGEIWLDGSVEGQGQEGGDQGASCGGPILGGGAGREVDMESVVGKEAPPALSLGQALQEGAGKGVGDVRALSHDLPKLTCNQNAALKCCGCLEVYGQPLQGHAPP